MITVVKLRGYAQPSKAGRLLMCIFFPGESGQIQLHVDHKQF